MKRKLWIAAWAALLLALLSTAALAEDVGANGYTTYSIAYNLTGMTAEGQPTTAVQGTSVDITLTTASGYELQLPLGERHCRRERGIACLIRAAL